MAGRGRIVAIRGNDRRQQLQFSVRQAAGSVASLMAPARFSIALHWKQHVEVRQSGSLARTSARSIRT